MPIATGYVLVYAPWHWSVQGKKNKHVLQHRIVMEQKLGRRLVKGEVVHHINGDRADNRPENLELKTVGQHMRDHLKGRKQGESHLRNRTAALRSPEARANNAAAQQARWAKASPEEREAHRQRMKHVAAGRKRDAQGVFLSNPRGGRQDDTVS